MKGALKSIELQVLRRAGCLKRVTSVESHKFKAAERYQFLCWQGRGLADSLLSLATQLNLKYPSYAIIRLFCDFISQLSCEE